MIRKQTFLILGLFFLFWHVSACNLEAGGKNTAIEQANQFYKQGNFEKAEEIYQTALKTYPNSAELHYNLGNAYFKLKKVGKAIREYERAKKIKPRDYELNENLAYVQGLIEYKVEDKRNWYLIHWERFLRHFSWDEIVLGSLVIYTFFVFLLLPRFLLRRNFGFFKFVKPLFIMFILSCIPLVSKYSQEKFYQDAVVISPNAEVRYGPSLTDKVGFRLVQGLKVQIQEKREDWYLVGLLNGESGWCEKKNLEVV